jgi:hypothetical protein
MGAAEGSMGSGSSAGGVGVFMRDQQDGWPEKAQAWVW